MGLHRVENNEQYTAPVSGASIIAVTSVANTDIRMVDADGVQVFAATPMQDLLGHQTQEFAIPGGYTIFVSGGAGQHTSVEDNR